MNASIVCKEKWEFVVEDASHAFPEYPRAHPETSVPLAFFSFDLYKPARDMRKAIKPKLTKGCALPFDELYLGEFLRETFALKEVFGLDRYAIKRNPYTPPTSYLVVE